MWLLKDKDGNIKYLKPNRTFTVGRKEGNLVLPENSVSRHHAEITVVPKKDIFKIENYMEPLSYCIIKDPGAKYGNFILGAGDAEMRITKDGYKFKHMDRVRFGVQDSIYIVMYVSLITSTSGLDAGEKNTLRLTIDKIGGKITPGWEKICTHMTVSNPNISEKLTCALAYGTPIVPMEYWKFVSKAFEANEEMPNPLNFGKLIHEKMAMLGDICVLPNPLRKTLFNNLTFVHFDSQQYKLYERIIQIAGGKSLLYKNDIHRNLDVCDDNVIVVQLIESNTTQATGTGDAKYAIACEKLGKFRRRTIPTGEIALAIYHVSTKKFCNPKHDHAQMFKSRKFDNPPENSSVLAQDTQDVDFPATTSRRGQLDSRAIVRETKTSGKLELKNDYVKESTEESSTFDSQPVEIVQRKSSDYLSESSASFNQLEKCGEKKSSLLTQDWQSKSDESVIVASLNFNKYLKNDFSKEISINENSMKRNREDDEKIDTTKKKICRDVSINERHNEKLNVIKKKTDKSYEDWMPDEEDFMFIAEDRDTNLSKTKQQKAISKISHKLIDKEILIKKSIADRDFRATDRDGENKIASTSKNALNSPKKNEPPLKFQKEDRTSLKHQNEEEISRKRKIGRPENSSSDIDSSSKRNKITTSDEKKSLKVSLDAATGEKNLHKFPNETKIVDLKNEWTPIKKSRKGLKDSTDVFTTRMNISKNGRDEKSSINRGSNMADILKKPGDPGKSTQPLLRIESPDEVTILNLAKFGKKFSKAYQLIPQRLEMDNMIDMHSWSELDKVSKTSISSDEEAVSIEKKSPNSKKKKTLRL